MNDFYLETLKLKENYLIQAKDFFFEAKDIFDLLASNSRSQ